MQPDPEREMSELVDDERGTRLHLGETNRRPCAHPSSWEVHHLELILGQQDVGLCMRN